MTDEEIAEDMIEEMEKDLDKVIKYETLAECYINDDMGPLGLNLPHDLLRNAVAAIQGNCEHEVKLAFIAGRKSID